MRSCTLSLFPLLNERIFCLYDTDHAFLRDYRPSCQNQLCVERSDQVSAVIIVLFRWKFFMILTADPFWIQDVSWRIQSPGKNQR